MVLPWPWPAVSRARQCQCGVTQTVWQQLILVRASMWSWLHKVCHYIISIIIVSQLVFVSDARVGWMASVAMAGTKCVWMVVTKYSLRWAHVITPEPGTLLSVSCLVLTQVQDVLPALTMDTIIVTLTTHVYTQVCSDWLTIFLILIGQSRSSVWWSPPVQWRSGWTGLWGNV